MRALISFSVVSISVLALGCQNIKTRQDQGKRIRNIPAISEVRKENADLKAKVVSLEDDLRAKEGRIEELEVHINNIKETNAETLKEESEVVAAYKESVNALIAEKKELQKQLSLIKEQNEETQEKLKTATTPASSFLKKGNTLFENKKWTEAISSYQNYREKTENKKSEDYALVTYKIGVCFQELGLVNEARTFYSSVVKNFSEDTAAYKYSKYRLSVIDSDTK